MCAVRTEKSLKKEVIPGGEKTEKESLPRGVGEINLSPLFETLRRVV
jgi:hypothetical protein